jgi:RND family efflux transporter MFP subunit
MTTFRAVLAVVTIAALVGLAAPGCKKTQAEEGAGTYAEKPIVVDVVTAGQGGSAGEIRVSGTLEPRNLTKVATKQSGLLTEVYVDVGDVLKKGQPMAQIDPSDFRLNLQNAEALYLTAQTAFETAEADYRRIETLAKDGSISPSDFEKATLGYKAAQNQLAQAQAGLDYAKSKLADATIRAPYDGQVIARVVSPGSYVDPMTAPILFGLVDNSRLTATLKVPESRAVMVKVGDAVTLRVPSAGRELKATIRVMTDWADPATHSRVAVAYLDNVKDPIASGLFFEASILPDALKGKVLLPASAIRDGEGQGTYVYVVAGGKAVRRALKGAFLADRSDFVVEDGIQAGDQVIRESTMVRDGQAVVAAGVAAAAR